MFFYREVILNGSYGHLQACSTSTSTDAKVGGALTWVRNFLLTLPMVRLFKYRSSLAYK